MTEPTRRSHRLLAATGVAAALALAPVAGASATPAAASAPTSISHGASGSSSAAKRAAAEISERFGVSGIGGYRSGGGKSDHASGNAIDVPAHGAKGDRIAAWVKKNSGRLGVKYVIWEQRYWQPGMSSGRTMEDRGSATQNHFDHVHISFES